MKLRALSLVLLALMLAPASVHAARTADCTSSPNPGAIGQDITFSALFKPFYEVRVQIEDSTGNRIYLAQAGADGWLHFTTPATVSGWMGAWMTSTPEQHPYIQAYCQSEWINP